MKRMTRFSLALLLLGAVATPVIAQAVTPPQSAIDRAEEAGDPGPSRPGPTNPSIPSY